MTILLFATLHGVHADGAVKDAAAKPVSIMILGDSLSDAYGISQQQGWVNLLRNRLEEQEVKASVINASSSGETTRGGYARLPDLLSKHDPSLVIIELGGNDGLRGIPPGEIETNLNRMIELSQNNGSRVLILGVRIPPNYGAAYTTRFHQVYTRTAEQQNIPLVPSFLQDIAENPQLMQDDGVHPKAEAQPRMLDNVWPTLAELLMN